MNWEGERAQILTFAVAPAAGAAAAWWSVRSPAAARWSGPMFRRVAVAAWLLTRLGTYAVVFHVFRYAGGDDLLRVWAPVARTVLAGGDPSPLVDNLHGPLFPWELAARVWCGGGHAPAAGLGFLAGDALSLVLLIRIARRHLPEAASRRVLLLTLLSPVLWHGLGVRGSSSWWLLVDGGVPRTVFVAGLVITTVACVAAAASATGAAHVAWQIERAGAGAARPSARAQTLLVPFLATQVVLTWLNPEHWLRFPVLIAGFVAWTAVVGWDALRGPWGQRASAR